MIVNGRCRRFLLVSKALRGYVDPVVSLRNRESVVSAAQQGVSRVANGERIPGDFRSRACKETEVYKWSAVRLVFGGVLVW